MKQRKDVDPLMEAESPPTRGRELKRTCGTVAAILSMSPPTRGRELKHRR